MKIRGYKVDLQSDKVSEHYALVYTPGRQRNRFSENCVHILNTEEQCLSHANRIEHLRAAKVLGPCRSSEAVNLYYLVNWLDDNGFPQKQHDKN